MTAKQAIMTLETRSTLSMGQTVYEVLEGPLRGRRLVEWTQYGRTWYQWDRDFIGECA